MQPPLEPLVSVIIPCRGRAALLARALESVRAQSEGRWEAIVVDDASAAPLVGVAAATGDARVRCLRLARNGGPGAARMAGLAAARAPMAAFLDSDDVWAPEKLARQLSHLRERPGRVHVSGVRVEGPAGDWRVRPARATRPGERIASFLYVANQFAQASGIMAPTALARAAGFGPGLRQYEDHFFLLRAEALGAAVEVTAEPLAEQRADAGEARAGRRDDAARARAFLAAAGGMMTARERLGFRLRCLGAGLAEEDRAAALGLALRGAFAGGRLSGAAARLALRAAAGGAAYEALRGRATRAPG